MIAILAFDGTCYGLIEKEDIEKQKKIFDYAPKAEYLFVEVNSLEELRKTMDTFMIETLGGCP